MSNLLKAHNPFSMPLPPILLIHGSLAQSPGCTCFPYDDRSLQEQVRQILVLHPGTAAHFTWTSHMPHRACWLRQSALAEMSELHDLLFRPHPFHFLFVWNKYVLSSWETFLKKIWKTVISFLTSETHLSSNHSEAYIKLFQKPKCSFVFFRKYRQIFGM